MSYFDSYIKRLSRDLRKLEASAVDVSKRKRSRSRVLASLRLLRAAVDREYPAIIERNKSAPRLKTFEGKLQRAQKSGWRSVGAFEASTFAAEGIKVKRISGELRGGGTNSVFLAPSWAVVAKVQGIAELRAAKKNRVVRKSVLASAAL